MNQTISLLKRHSLLIGIVLMFLLTWPIELSSSSILPFRVPFIVALLVGYGITFAALLMTGLTLGKDGLIALLKRFLIWRVRWKWYLAAFLLQPALIALGVYGNAALTGTAPDFSTVMAHKIFGGSANLWLFVLPFFLVDFITNGEEMGWRGYVLPRLQAKYNALISTLILGVIWGLWHLPKFLSHWSILSFGWFMLHILASSVILTWLYSSTRGSLLLVTIMHASANTAGVFFPTAGTVSSENMGAYIGYVLCQVIVALIVIALTGPEHLSRQAETNMKPISPSPAIIRAE
jgi:membrane protease YdiL (CAAX protease family)